MLIHTGRCWWIQTECLKVFHPKKYNIFHMNCFFLQHIYRKSVQWNLAWKVAAKVDFAQCCPLAAKSNLLRGRMWLISDYILNEGWCWLVPFIGTMISNYCSPEVGRQGIMLKRERSKSKEGEKNGIGCKTTLEEKVMKQRKSALDINKKG